MKRYRIEFYGCVIGQLNTAAKDRVSRVVEAETEEGARMCAYDKHEHIIHPIKVTELEDNES